MAKLYGIGVGPGDKELLTLKAVRIIQSCEVVVVPSSMEGSMRSIALETARDFIKEGTEVIVKYFPMAGGENEVSQKVYEAFETIEKKLKAGKNVAFFTIGDPFVYSTYIYLLEHMEKLGYDTETVPGITSFCACASLAKEPLVIGDEPLLILPASRVDDIRDEKFVVIMKVFKLEEKVISKLEEKGFKYVYVKKAGREGQEVIRDRNEIINNREYMSLIIASRS